MLLVESLVGLAAGALLMFAVRHLGVSLYLVPVAVALGPLVMALRRKTPSKAFLLFYIVFAGALFTLMALMGPGVRDSFDPP